VRLVGTVPPGGVDVARDLREQARRLAHHAFDESRLAAQLDALRVTADQAGATWGGYEAPVQSRAGELAALPGASDTALRARFRGQASAAADAAGQRHAAATTDLTHAHRLGPGTMRFTGSPPSTRSVG
jgi:hypothetical protein